MRSSKHWLLLICIWVFVSLGSLAQTLLISELVADNNNTLKDGDGDSPDWIELYNNTDAVIDLAGWCLTDDTNTLAQWIFPSTNIAPRGFLLVFASDKDRAVAGEELHTNFKLSSKGDYIGLVRPDGTTLEDDVFFPTLQEDVSYGYASKGESHPTLLNTGASCSAHIPTSETDAIGWRDPSFDDSDWMHGTTGVGYDTQSAYTPWIGLDTLAMKGVNASVYIRIPFVFPNTSDAKSLTLNIKYDEGFVAYLNGTQVQTANFTNTPSWNSRATGWHGWWYAKDFETFDLSAHRSLLQEGTNTLAIHGMNNWQGGEDLLFLPRLEAELFVQMDATTRGFLGTPTPGMPNPNQLYDGILETPVVVSPEHGFFDMPLLAELSYIESTVAIRYTLDGSTPSADSPLYSSPLSISTTTVLRASAFREGWKPSLPRTESYLFLDDVIHQPRTSSTNYTGQILRFGMDPDVVATSYTDASGNPVTVKDALQSVPTLSIVTDHENLFDPDIGIYVNAYERWERPASFELICPDGTAEFNVNAGLRIRGGYSRHPTNPKHSFRLFFRSEYGMAKLHYPLFENEGVDEFDKIDLRTPQNYSWAWPRNPTNTFLRDVFVRDTSRDMHQPYTRSRYYHLYLNGQYWGLYQTEERPEARYAASYFGGDPEDYDVVKAVGSSDPEEEPYTIKTTDGTLDAYHRLFVASTNGFANNSSYFSVQGLDSSGQTDPQGETLLDVENLIDYLLQIHHAGAADNSISYFIDDSKVNNFYTIYNRTHPDGFKWFQHDSEHAFDSTPDLDRTGPFTNSNFNLPKYFNPQTLHDRLVANAEYRMAFADQVYKHFFNDGALAPSNNAVRLDARAAEIDRAMVALSARWGSTNLTRYTWTNAVADTRAFLVLSNRCEQVVEYLRADGLIPSILPPRLNHSGGLVNPGTSVALSSGEGTLYYTTDGSDPRAIGGTADGRIYFSPLVISKPTIVRARCQKLDGEWSALTEAVFWLPEAPLAITELMYHAVSNQLDFIELRNIASHPVSLRGYSLNGAVGFNFDPRILAPGEYAVVVKDIASFSIAYPTATDAILGEYKGDFDNNGEKVELEFGKRDQVEFTYSDARNWPQAADGAGHSLVPLHSAMMDQERGSLDDGGNWRASTFTGGSPGGADPEGIPTVLLNEITAHTDTGQSPPFDSNDQIELYNPTPSDITLAGWYLSDDLENQKWPIPDGTVVPAFGFALFDENDFHPDRISGFGLNKAGEQVVLSAPGQVIDSIRFKGQANGASLGRYPDGSKDWMTTRPTPGTSNQTIEPSVWIRALMYHPANDDESLEYIQLENQSSTTVLLEGPDGPYRLSGEVSFTIPPSTAVPAGETLWLVPFDPMTDTAQLALFCTTYSLNSTEESFLGPYQGFLSNRGGRVTLERPQGSDDPLKPFDISWVVMDELYYFDRAPWPEEADGTGQPLLRTGRTTWGAPTAFDIDADSLPDIWETDHGVDNPSLDSDGDGPCNLDEYVAGTDPSDPTSRFDLHVEDFSLSWPTANGRRYDVLWAPSLNRGFQILAAALPSSISNYVDTAHPASPTGFYKVVARLPDSTDRDGDGLPDAWEMQYFTDTNPMDDPDGDGMSNIGEYFAGTDPSDPSDFLRVSQTWLGKEMILQWDPSAYGRIYTVLFTPSLDIPFKILKSGIAYPHNRFTNTAIGFYKVEASFP